MINAYIKIQSVKNALTRGVKVEADTFELHSPLIVSSHKEEDRRIIIAIDWGDTPSLTRLSDFYKPTIPAIMDLLEEPLISVFMYDRIIGSASPITRRFSHFDLVNPQLLNMWFEHTSPRPRMGVALHPTSNQQKTYLLLSFTYDKMKYMNYIDVPPNDNPLSTLGFDA